ncbi:uncharacterized protein LOC116848260 [Odontomachus brunneus]|uniref:uncharacterized protein LOC116848260 n=1 Tax=Odontomachus brunneus TaxID=486640 RepID=UPI0013F20056|nr:uncharacterized protein LOC116848260 [Odontomachus brunneus]
MSDDRWNDDVAYAFDTHKMFMNAMGLWPLQKMTPLATIRWGLLTILLFGVFAFVSMEFTRTDQDAGKSIETMLFSMCTGATLLKNYCFTTNRKRLAKNINVAIDDWIDAKNDAQAYKIMKKYAFQSRLFTSVILYLANICTVLYIMVIFLLNNKQNPLDTLDINTTDLDEISRVANISTTDWTFVLPSGDLGKIVSSIPLYAVLIVIQSIQITLISESESIMDAFYTNVTLHLAGQLELLKIKIKKFASEPDTVVNHRKQFAKLINRHCVLMELNHNLEKTFNLIILYQLLIVTLLLALLGLRILISIKDHDYVILSKSALALSYVFTESVVYCYCGDFVQSESEELFHALYATSWFTLPASLMKDVRFAMMKSSYAFQLSGGKFFSANRQAMFNVVKTAASYISVLRVSIME